MLPRLRGRTYALLADGRHHSSCAAPAAGRDWKPPSGAATPVKVLNSLTGTKVPLVAGPHGLNWCADVWSERSEVDVLIGIAAAPLSTMWHI
jgi:hypothetical protein